MLFYQHLNFLWLFIFYISIATNYWLTQFYPGNANQRLNVLARFNERLHEIGLWKPTYKNNIYERNFSAFLFYFMLNLKILDLSLYSSTLNLISWLTIIFFPFLGMTRHLYSSASLNICKADRSKKVIWLCVCVRGGGRVCAWVGVRVILRER